MHPLLARRDRLALYAFLWLLVGVLLSGLLAVQPGFSWRLAAAGALPLAIVFSFVCLSAYYVARGLPLTGTGTLRIVATAATAAAISSAIWVVLARKWLDVLSQWTGAAGAPAVFERGVQPLLFGFGMLLYLLSLAVSYLLAAFEASQQGQRRSLQAQVLAREAELRTLRAQIDPHFLFNSLNSISALTTADSAGARRMCLLLSDFLRETLALGSETRIPLARELSLAERFLAVERVRFGKRLEANISAGDAGACLVPPLILQPLVENAVTHGIAHVLEGGTVRVHADRNGSRLRIIVENPCDPDRPRGGGAGLGIANVRSRLRALHGSEATLLAEERGPRWRVELIMPAEDVS